MAYAASESDFNTKIHGLDGLWATRTGGEASVEVNKTHNGGDRWPIPVVGNYDIAELVLTRSFDPRSAQALVKALRPRIGSDTRTISQQPTMTDGTIVGEATVWTECILRKVKEPDTNSGSANAALVELTYVPGGIR